MTVEVALKRYLAEIVPTKRSTSQIADIKRATILTKHLGKYSLAALTPEIVAKFRDARLAGDDRKNAEGKPQPRANNTVRLDLALLGHLFTVAIKEWDVGLPSNPVMNIRRPAPGSGRNRRLTAEEEHRILAAVDRHSNPMLGWIVRIALETGMRLSEIVTLRRGQVDLDRRIVRLLHRKNTQPRTVPLTTAATDLFRSADLLDFSSETALRTLPRGSLIAGVDDTNHFNQVFPNCAIRQITSGSGPRRAR